MGPYFAMLLTTNDVSHCVITTHLLNSNLSPFSWIRIIDKDYKAFDFGYSVPDLLVSSIVTIYFSPTLIGFLGAFDPTKRLLLLLKKGLLSG